MVLVDIGVFYATYFGGGTRQATAATKWAPIPACSGIQLLATYVESCFETTSISRTIVVNWPLLLAQHGEIVELLLGQRCQRQRARYEVFRDCAECGIGRPDHRAPLSKDADINAKKGRYGSAL
jgi:hypothetical protein